MGGGEGQPGEITVGHGNAEHFGQFINEASRSGGTRFVHVVVHYHAVPLDDKLGVLAADLDDVRFRVQFKRGPRLSGDLVLDEVSSDEAADQVSAGTGDTHAVDSHPVSTILTQVPEDLPDRFNRSSGSHQVALGQDFSRVINYHRLGAGGANVNAEITCAFVLYGTDRIVVLGGYDIEWGHFKVALLCV